METPASPLSSRARDPPEISFCSRAAGPTGWSSLTQTRPTCPALSPSPGRKRSPPSRLGIDRLPLSPPPTAVAPTCFAALKIPSGKSISPPGRHRGQYALGQARNPPRRISEQRFSLIQSDPMVAGIAATAAIRRAGQGGTILTPMQMGMGLRRRRLTFMAPSRPRPGPGMENSKPSRSKSQHLSTQRWL